MEGEWRMAKKEALCDGHEKHLCTLAEGGLLERDLENFKALVRAPYFVCRRCGRVANAAGSLCEPEEI
jgi:hypothetical protein